MRNNCNAAENMLLPWWLVIGSHPKSSLFPPIGLTWGPNVTAASTWKCEGAEDVSAQSLSYAKAVCYHNPYRCNDLVGVDDSDAEFISHCKVL